MLSTRERSGDDRFVLLDLAQGIGLRTLDGATRLFELNLRATRALVDETTGRLRAAFDPQARGAVPVPPMPDIERATSYSRDIYRIVAGTSAEIVELMQRHVRGDWIQGATRLGGTQADMQRAAQDAAAALARAGEQDLSQQQPVVPAPSAVLASPSEQADPNEAPDAPSAAHATPPAATAAPASAVASDVAAPVAAADVTTDSATLAEATVATVLQAAAAPAAMVAALASEPALALPPSELAAPSGASQAPTVQRPDPPVAPLAPQPIAQAVQEAIGQIAQPDAAPVVPEASKRPRATRIGRAASRKSAPNAS